MAEHLTGGVDCEQLMKELGQFRRFHLMNYLLLAVVAASTSFYWVNYIFLAADVPYRCVVPECESANSTEFSPPWVSAALPASGRQARCFRRAALDSTRACDPTSAYSDDLMPCDNWLYESHDTIVAEYNLACQEWKRTLVGTIHNIGMLVSLPVFGYISDRWGRKLALILSCVLVAAIGLVKAFSVSYEMYIIVEFLETVAGASAFPAIYIMTIELLGNKKRMWTSTFLGVMSVIGSVGLALLTKAYPYWRTVILIAYPPSLLFVSYIYLLPESIRWLLSKGRKEEAVKIIMNAANMNKVKLSDELMKQLHDTVILEDTTREVKKYGLWTQVLKSPIIMGRLAICSWGWITCTFVYYGLAINSVSLVGDKYTNYILVSIVEVPAVVANGFLLNRIGRKRTLLITFVVCGVACIVITFIPRSMPWLVMVFYLVGKIAITQACSAIYVYTVELFPTRARHSLLGFCSMVGRLGSIIAPQMPLLAVYVEWLPSVLFGSAALVAAALTVTTPETLNRRLPDTIQEAEALARRQSAHDDLPLKSHC